MSIHVWTSECAYERNGTRLSIAKYDDKIRRQAALVVGTPSSVHVAAYFRNEEEARMVADVFFGGVREVTP